MLALVGLQIPGSLVYMLGFYRLCMITGICLLANHTHSISYANSFLMLSIETVPCGFVCKHPALSASYAMLFAVCILACWWWIFAILDLISLPVCSPEIATFFMCLFTLMWSYVG